MQNYYRATGPNVRGENGDLICIVQSPYANDARTEGELSAIAAMIASALNAHGLRYVDGVMRKIS